MNIDEFKLLSKEQLIEYGKNIPEGIIKDDRGNELTYKNSDGTWYECTYDINNNRLTFKYSNGYWSEYTYDINNNNELTVKDSYGYDGIALIKGQKYALWYDSNSKKYKAGCQMLTYDECVKFYKNNKDTYDDKELFMNTIEEHHKNLEEI